MLIYHHFVNTFNSLRPSGIIWRQRYGSSLVWVIIDAGNGLLPYSTKPLPIPVLTNYHWGLTGFCQGQPHRNLLTDLSLKIINSRLQAHLPGAEWKLNRADSRSVPRQWEMALQSILNTVIASIVNGCFVFLVDSLPYICLHDALRTPAGLVIKWELDLDGRRIACFHNKSLHCSMSWWLAGSGFSSSSQSHHPSPHLCNKNNQILLDTCINMDRR